MAHKMVGKRLSDIVDNRHLHTKEHEDQRRRNDGGRTNSTLDIDPTHRRARSAEDLSPNSITSARVDPSTPPVSKHSFGLKGLFHRKKDNDAAPPIIEISHSSERDAHPVSYAQNIHNLPVRPSAFNRVLQQIRSQPAMLRSSETKVPSVSKLTTLRTRSDGSDNDKDEAGRGSRKGSSLPRDSEMRARAESARIATREDHIDFLSHTQADSTVCGTPSYGSDMEQQDETDSVTSPDPQRTKFLIEQTLAKIDRTKEAMKAEQNAKDENVSEYLKLSAQADKIQLQRIKTVFEKKNQKSNATIAHLQKKLENYHKKLIELETNGAVGPRKPKEVFHGMQQGLRGVRDNIKEGITGFSGGVADRIGGGISGLTELTQSAASVVVSKPKEIAHKFKNKFGSADNIDNTDEEEEVDQPHKTGRSSWFAPTPAMAPKSNSEGEESSSMEMTENGHLMREELEEHPLVGRMTILQDRISELAASEALLQMKLEEVKEQTREQYQFFNQALADERYQAERLEEQLADLTDLHNHALTNMQQELSSMEERLEYRSAERERDVLDNVDQCQTRISKIELAQQHQQVITLEGYENANARALLSKLINVVLSVLAVLLLIISTVTNAVSPFVATRGRLLTTVMFSFLFFCIWQRREVIEDLTQHIVENYKHLFYINSRT
ncbi:transmembrane and coiled-coil domains protein 2-like isoform X2 [Acanthaster planci]|uniref:Transmembrane and coiled-coil domains protein 2-like isoform X2 n=1 Tax=Acanthaster planci TaxID=133434 RepID=A0A8B7YF86_ACAPL|nr:transmembrane and coiled-coil domains protein 2-like isoform X2 [Acanthaster planci]